MKKIVYAILVAVLCLMIGSATVAMAEEHVHSYGEWNVKTAASCSATGTKVRMCSTCGNVESETIPTVAHSYGEWNVKTAATCSATGTKVRMCSNCGNVESETIPTVGHNYGEWNVKTAATCIATGTKVRMCSTCGNVESETIPTVGHSYGEWNVKTAATCTADGTKVRMCSTCGNVESETLLAVGHNYGEWNEKTAATCTADGSKVRICSNCGNVESEVLPAVGHAYRTRKVAPTLTKGGYTRYTCKNCGHSYVAHRTDALAASIGSIVFNAADVAMPYTMTEENDVCVITAEADANGVYTLRKLVLVESLINELSELGKTEIRFVVGEYALVIPVNFVAQDALIALGEADEYVFTVDGLAENGCLVKAESVAGEVAQEATASISGLKLCKGTIEIDVTETMEYVIDAQ